MVHYHRKSRTSKKGRSKRGSIVTMPSEVNKEDMLEFMLEHIGERGYYPREDHLHMPSERTLKSLGDSSYLRKPRKSIFMGEVYGKSPDNAYEYISSLSMSSRLDRDFTHDGQRFVMLGAPFRLSPGIGFAALAKCLTMAEASDKDKKPLKALINLYHGVCAYYLGLLNHSFDCLDMMKEISKQIKNGSGDLSTTILLGTLGTLIPKFGNKDENSEKMIATYIDNHPNDMSNLQWGESNIPPYHLLAAKVLWSKIGGVPLDRSTQVIDKVIQLTKTNKEFADIIEEVGAKALNTFNKT